MCIPPVNDNPSTHFVLLKKLAMQNQLHHLSMGMSGDYDNCFKKWSNIYSHRKLNYLEKDN